MRLPPDVLHRATDPALCAEDAESAAEAVAALQPRLAEALDAAAELDVPAHVLVAAPSGAGAMDQVEALLRARALGSPTGTVAGWLRDPGLEAGARLLEVPVGRAAEIAAGLDGLRRDLRGVLALLEEALDVRAADPSAADAEDVFARARVDVSRRRDAVDRCRELVRELLEPRAGAWDDLSEISRAVERALEGTTADLEEGPRPGWPWRDHWWVPLGPAPDGPPLVRDDHPTWDRLFGRLPARSDGAPPSLADFRPGLLHRGRGRTLLLDADRVWSSGVAGLLRRVLDRRELALEDAEGGRDAVLDAPPMPLGDTRVVLVGSSRVIRALRAGDADAGLFPVVVELEPVRDRDDDGERAVARWFRAISPRPLEAGGAARLVEDAARRSGDARRLSLDSAAVVELVREAARFAGSGAVDADHVERALEVRRDRVDGLHRRTLAQIENGIVRIETSGTRVGQCNAIVVLRSSAGSFGRAARVSARARAGKGDVVAIEREAKLSGSVHQKGILILTSFLAGRYTSRTISLSASVVFEQNYGSIDGDSASLAELVALLSAITDVSVRQDRAVTGAIDQMGRVQAVGGICAKVEGFFELCAARGLDGEQGVVVPAVNVPQLMLSREVREAVAAGRFHVWSVETVDEALEVLIDRVPGRRQADGSWPDGSFNDRVARRLAPPPAGSAKAPPQRKKPAKRRPALPSDPEPSPRAPEDAPEERAPGSPEPTTGPSTEGRAASRESGDGA